MKSENSVNDIVAYVFISILVLCVSFLMCDYVFERTNEGTNIVYFENLNFCEARSDNVYIYHGSLVNFTNYDKNMSVNNCCYNNGVAICSDGVTMNKYFKELVK